MLLTTKLFFRFISICRCKTNILNDSYVRLAIFKFIRLKFINTQENLNLIR